MKKQANLGRYLQTVTDVLRSTEEMGGQLNEYFELANANVTEEKPLTDEQFAAIQESFSQGIEQYHQNVAALSKVAAPIMIIGPHKQLLKGYREFVAGCEHMQDSIDYTAHKIDGPAFKAAEQEQSEAMDHVNVHVGRIMQKVG
ncbi:hypothetical protein LPAF129_03400 [Ligilactobacillus pabuli]|uniref:Chemotaxis protein n=1 Tax=Ligilactobacillus pabuli TaxID=2886039 RepID=A0ABQ5JI29_9LACO|nr:hypothetical protein [Ligilactobacillus pabuli]GKS80655.1 hypothetical protein LPAF129_03400 [Ligilactobacillus pabuli]HIW89844.1 hypothetical protein [Candidatus Ligilactobacillus excrementipullorum]